MQAQFFKSSTPAKLNDEVRAFIADNGRTLRDVRIAFGIASDGGTLDYAIAAVVLYDEPAPKAAPRFIEHFETDPDGARLAGMDRRRDEAVAADATRVRA